MLKQWDVFTQKSSSRTDAIRVSLNKRGIFSLNQKAFESLQETEKVEMLFDKANQLIGMRPCAPDVKHGYALKKQGKSNSYIVRGKAFCNFYNIKPRATVLFDEPEVDEDGVLILNLNKVSEVAMRSPRAKQVEKANSFSLFEQPSRFAHS